MKIVERSIQQVKDVSIVSVVNHYLKLNRNNMACCPFHNENTPSFKVSEHKGIFKCFGCGIAGDGIAFVMQHEKFSFIEAVAEIARLENISLEYEEVQDKEAWEKQKTLHQQMQEVLSQTITVYRNKLWYLERDHPAREYIRQRQLTNKEVAEWQLGWSGTDWRYMAPGLIGQHLFTPAEKLGILKRNKADDGNYDGYRSRIIIPIADHLGRYIGLAGRFLEVDPADKGKQYPKYINPPENELYQKRAVLFGLDRAAKSIKQLGFVFLVEGYFDVISLHKVGDTNTVGTCGTALTIEQAKLLRRYTNRVIILRDGDAAGIKAAKNDLNILLKEGFKVEIAILPKGEDPDSYLLKANSYQTPNPFLNGVHFEDAIYWQVDDLVQGAAGDAYQTGLVKQQTVELLSNIPNELIRNNYFDSIIKRYKWNGKDLQRQLNNLAEEKEDVEVAEGDQLDRMPKWMDKEEFLNKGFCAVKNDKRCGYYSFSGAGQVEITNFIITPLFHVEGKESRHLIQIDNGKRKAVLDLESKALVSVELLQQYIVTKGAFVIYGSKAQILRIATTLLNSFPSCYEIHFLGWQQEGFFAFVDKIFIPGEGLKDLDEWGIISYKNNNYLVPAASAAYRELQRSGDDPYENDRYLTYTPATITFETWAKQMARVYMEKGIVGIAYAILTVFRDIVFSVDNNCPHLYGYGERSAGKSKWAESICALFYKKRAAFNLNSGTDFAFFNYMQRFKNCPAHLNEFDEGIIRPEWFQNIKGIYDGEGRQRGVMGSNRRTEIMKVESTLILTGQYLVGMDDNSVVSRSLIEEFHEREMTDDDKKEFDKLKAWEDQGLSSLLIELLQHRIEFKTIYKDRFDETLSKWRRTTDSKQEFNLRIMQNWCHLATCYNIISNKVKMPVDQETFEAYCKDLALKWSRHIRSYDTLSVFWDTLAFMVNQGTLIEGWDFKIEVQIEVRIRKDRNEETTVQFNQPTKLLFIRLNNVHKYYLEAYRRQTGKEGMSMENLLHYFSGRKYFIGNKKQSRFEKWVTKIENKTFPGQGVIPETKKVKEQVLTSCYVFLYDPLEIDIEREPAMEAENG